MFKERTLRTYIWEERVPDGGCGKAEGTITWVSGAKSLGWGVGMEEFGEELRGKAMEEIVNFVRWRRVEVNEDGGDVLFLTFVLELFDIYLGLISCHPHQNKLRLPYLLVVPLSSCSSLSLSLFLFSCALTCPPFLLVLPMITWICWLSALLIPPPAISSLLLFQSSPQGRRRLSDSFKPGVDSGLWLPVALIFKFWLHDSVWCVVINAADGPGLMQGFVDLQILVKCENNVKASARIQGRRCLFLWQSSSRSGCFGS